MLVQEYGLRGLMVDFKSLRNLARQGTVFLNNKSVHSHIFASCESSQFLSSRFADRTLQGMFEKENRRL